jgi:hypothetical protein
MAVPPRQLGSPSEPSAVALELEASHVLRLPIEEVSAKVRAGPPGDGKEDYDLTCWGGVLPF